MLGARDRSSRSCLCRKSSVGVAVIGLYDGIPAAMDGCIILCRVAVLGSSPNRTAASQLLFVG